MEPLYPIRPPAARNHKHGLILIWLVQHAGFPGDGRKAQDAFRQAALKSFAK